MDWKKILKPTAGKIGVIIVYLILISFISIIINPGCCDRPVKHGFPFTYKIEGCYNNPVLPCINKSYPYLFIMNILIHTLIIIIIYLGVGIISSRKNERPI